MVFVCLCDHFDHAKYRLKKLKGDEPMKFRTMAAAVAALTLTTSPVLAQTAVDRSAAPIEGESELRGSSSLLLILCSEIIKGSVKINSNY